MRSINIAHSSLIPMFGTIPHRPPNFRFTALLIADFPKLLLNVIVITHCRFYPLWSVQYRYSRPILLVHPSSPHVRIFAAKWISEFSLSSFGLLISMFSAVAVSSIHRLPTARCCTDIELLYCIITPTHTKIVHEPPYQIYPR